MPKRKKGQSLASFNSRGRGERIASRSTRQQIPFSTRGGNGGRDEPCTCLWESEEMGPQGGYCEVDWDGCGSISNAQCWDNGIYGCNCDCVADECPVLCWDGTCVNYAHQCPPTCQERINTNESINWNNNDEVYNFVVNTAGGTIEGVLNYFKSLARCYVTEFDINTYLQEYATEQGAWGDVDGIPAYILIDQDGIKAGVDSIDLEGVYTGIENFNGSSNPFQLRLEINTLRANFIWRIDDLDITFDEGFCGNSSSSKFVITLEFTPVFINNQLDDYNVDIGGTFGYEQFTFTTGIAQELCDCCTWCIACWLECVILGSYVMWAETLGDLITNIGLQMVIQDMINDAIGPDGIDMSLNLAPGMAAALDQLAELESLCDSWLGDACNEGEVGPCLFDDCNGVCGGDWNSSYDDTCCGPPNTNSWDGRYDCISGTCTKRCGGSYSNLGSCTSTGCSSGEGGTGHIDCRKYPFAPQCIKPEKPPIVRQTGGIKNVKIK